VALADGAAYERLSKADYVEKLLRRAAARRSRDRAVLGPGQTEVDA
jgi:hypothetical protein